jgi:ribonuclease HI
VGLGIWRSCGLGGVITMFEQLCAVAYKKERVLGRRLAKNMQLSEEEVLKQILTKAANNRSLEHLISERLQAIENAAKKLIERKQQQADALAKKRASKQPDPSAWVAWFDGATSPNPGKMGIGGLLNSPDGRTVEISFAAGHGDSNEAEYLALIAVLEEAVRIQPDKLMVYGDSRIVIDAMNCESAVGSNNLKNFHEQAKRLIAQLNAVSLHWTPRKKNAAADALSQRGLLIS